MVPLLYYSEHCSSIIGLGSIASIERKPKLISCNRCVWKDQLHCHINQPFSEDSQRDSEMAGVVHRHHHFARRGYRQRCMLNVPSHWSNTPLRSCMSGSLWEGWYRVPCEPSQAKTSTQNPKESRSVCGRPDPHCSPILCMWDFLSSCWWLYGSGEISCVWCGERCVNRTGQPGQRICFFSKGQPDCPGQAQLFSFGEYAQYYWSNRLHTCAYTSTSWEWMGVYKQKGEPQHQCPTCVWCWPHHHQLRCQVAWVCPWCTHPEGERSI